MDAAGRTAEDCLPSSVHRLEFDVAWPPQHVASYLLEGPEPILIDAGAPGDGAEADLEEGLAAAGYDVGDVAHVLVTHPHVDHLGLLPTLREAGATVHAPGPALDFLRGDLEARRATARSVARSIGYEGDGLSEVVDETYSVLAYNRTLLDPDDARPIDPDSPFAVGGREFAPIETPGHQIHQLCFATTIDGTRALFAGDALIEPFRPGAFHVWLGREAYDGIDALSVAMDNLEDAGASVAYPGHGPILTDPDGVVSLTRDRIESLLEGTRSALAAIEPAAPLAVAEERSGEIQHVVQLLDTVAALGGLERRGEATYAERDGARYYERT